MLTCREVSERANDYIDGQLGLWSAIEVRMHLMACKYCRAFMRQMRTVVRLVGEYGYELPDEVLDDHLMQAYRKANAQRRGTKPDAGK